MVPSLLRLDRLSPFLPKAAVFQSSGCYNLHDRCISRNGVDMYGATTRRRSLANMRTECDLPASTSSFVQYTSADPKKSPHAPATQSSPGDLLYSRIFAL